MTEILNLSFLACGIASICVSLLGLQDAYYTDNRTDNCANQQYNGVRKFKYGFMIGWNAGCGFYLTVYGFAWLVKSYLI